MATQHLYSKIKELGDVYNRRDDLRTFCKLHFEEIMNSFSRRILNSDGAEVLNGLFNGLSESLTSVQKLKVKVADTVLQVMRQESTSTTHCRNITSRLCLELPRIPVETLVKWCGDSVQSIIADKDVNMIWRDVLPECLNTLSSYDTVQHCGTEMTTTEYQQQCIHTLLQCKWKEEQLVQLATMFKEIQLPREEHKQVVNKLCSYTIDITPDALPPLVHQLLKLCKVYNMEIVLVHLSHYFNIHLYSKLEPPPQDSESTTMDIDDIVQHSTTELSRCLSTCIYHISQGAADPELIRKHIKLWPKSQLLRSPFMIDLALALSDKGTDFRTVCLDAIRSSIEMRVLDELRSLESASARVVIPPDIHVTTVLKVITADSANHRELTVPGLIHLAFSLLSTARSRPASTTCWSHGKLILVRLSKAQPETAAHILSQLNDKLVSDLQPQFSDCLYILCKLTPVSIERCSQLSTILECTQPRGDWRLPASVYNAVHPLVNFSSRTRDTLLMICRKGLYSRDSNYRCLALSGFLTILQFIKLSKNTFSSSQSNSEQYSTHSYLTQMTVDLHATQQGAVVTSRVRNEATCMEVVSILRRCLLHDADVKQLLYSNLRDFVSQLGVLEISPIPLYGTHITSHAYSSYNRENFLRQSLRTELVAERLDIYECAKEKPILHESILELLYEHLVKYLPEDNEETIQLKFDKCVQVTATNAVLLEPIGYLIYCISQFLQSADNEELEDILSSQDVDTSSTHLKNKLNSVLSKLCGSDELAHVDLDEVGLTDLTPESKCKAIKVQQMLLCYEALIAHLVTQWSLTTTQANDVYKLYKCYNQLLEQTKTPSKQSKKNAKSLNDTRESTKSQKTQKSQPDKGKGPMKLSNLVKDRAGPFKPLPSVWNLRTCLRIMELLYSEEVPWSTTEQRNQIRTRRDFHHFVLRAVLAVLSNEHLEKRMVATYVVKIANLLFHRYICRFQSMCDFDDQTALSCMDVFKQCLTVVMSLKYSLKLDVVMQNITGLSESSSPDCIAAILEQILVALAQIEADNLEEERDLLVKRLYNALIQTAAMLLEVHVPASTSIHEVIIKLEEYMSSSKLDCIPLLQSLLAAGAREQLETKLLDEVLEKLTQLLPRATDEEDIAEESSQYPCINSKSCHTVLAIVCAHITHRCKSIEHLLNRCQCMVPPAFASEGQKMKIEKERSGIYKSIMIQLCQCVSWWSVGGGLRCAVGGAGSDKLLLLAVRLYQLLGLYAKRIAPEDAATVRFDRLLKISGKKFSSVIDDLIMYLEATQQQDSASKVLRDTKLIPRVVLAGEQFSKNVMLLAAKAKINFQQYLSLGTARDFRIKAPVLEQVLQARGQPDNDEEDNINDATTEVLSQDNEDNQSPRKRRRIS